MTKIKELKRATDYFISWGGGKEWYIIPTIIYLNNPNQYWENGQTSPAFGIYIQWLKLTIGFQSQKNPNYGK